MKMTQPTGLRHRISTAPSSWCISCCRPACRLGALAILGALSFATGFGSIAARAAQTPTPKKSGTVVASTASGDSHPAKPTASATKSKKSSSRSAKGSRPTSGTSASRHSSTRGSKSASSRKHGSRQSRVAVRRQTRPTPERYAEIQSALAKAGYYEGSANGVWGDSSVTALRRFQEDNGQEPTGKLDSLSLIKLGLGPNYESQSASAANGAAAPE